MITDFDIILKFISQYANFQVINTSIIKDIITLGIYSNSLLFFIIGGTLSRYKLVDKYSKKKIIYFSVVGIIIGIIGLLFIRYTSTHTYSWDGVYLSDGYRHIPTVLLATSLFLLLQTIDVKTNKIIDVISKNTLGIFYMHVIFLKCVRLLIKNYGIFYNSLKTIIVLVLCAVICYVLKKVKVVREIL